MSPTNLADLPSDQPVPTGRVSQRRGAVEGTYTWNNNYPAQPLQDGQGGNMSISISITRSGWWLIHAQSMWLQVDPIWSSFEWGVDLSAADLDGRSRLKVQHSMHSALGWQSSHVDALYRIGPGLWTATMMWLYSNGYNQRYHTNPAFMWIEGEFIEGAV